MIQDLKITEWNTPIVNEADRPQRSASEMKEIFDGNSNQLRAAVNNLIDALTTSGAEDIGATVEGLEGTTVQSLLAALKLLCDRVVTTGEGDAFLANDGTYKLPSVGAAANGLPVGGLKGMILVKNSDKFYDADWADVRFMSEDTYDTNGDGTVDKADDADKLGGKAASEYASKPIARSITLSMAEWTGAEAPFTQSINIEGVLADESKQVIYVSPAPNYGTMFGMAGVECIAQGENSLTFKCESAPDDNIVVNISILEAHA